MLSKYLYFNEKTGLEGWRLAWRKEPCNAVVMRNLTQEPIKCTRRLKKRFQPTFGKFRNVQKATLFQDYYTEEKKGLYCEPTHGTFLDHKINAIPQTRVY